MVLDKSLTYIYYTNVLASFFKRNVKNAQNFLNLKAIFKN